MLNFPNILSFYFCSFNLCYMLYFKKPLMVNIYLGMRTYINLVWAYCTCLHFVIKWTSQLFVLGHKFLTSSFWFTYKEFSWSRPGCNPFSISVSCHSLCLHLSNTNVYTKYELYKFLKTTVLFCVF